MTMHLRPRVVLSVAMSLDCCIDDTSLERLKLSNGYDFDRVDHVRSTMDAILVGAGTVRADNPSLLVKSAKRRADRVRIGKPASPIKVTLTNNGADMDPRSKFFTTGTIDKLVYTSDTAADKLTKHLDGAGQVIAAGTGRVDLPTMLADLRTRGVRSLMVEGGADIHRRFLASGLIDQLDVAIAPFFVGETDAPRFGAPGFYAFGKDNPLRLRDMRQLGDVVVMTYTPAHEAVMV